MRRKSTMKVARGRLEEERRKFDDAFEYQRVMLFILPLVMIAVLIIGAYFGYLSYSSESTKLSQQGDRAMSATENLTDQERDYLLTVVNSANVMDSSFVPKLKTVYDVEVSYLVRDDLKRLMSDAQSLGLNLKVTKGYVSFEEQKELYEEKVKAYKKKHKCSTVKAEAAVKKTTPNGGESEHQTGLLIEFSSDDKKFEKSDEYNFLVKNCINYGFVQRYTEKENPGGLKYSSTLFRYVGVENAKKMRSYNMNLDEYVIYLGAQ